MNDSIDKIKTNWRFASEGVYKLIISLSYCIQTIKILFTAESCYDKHFYN